MLEITRRGFDQEFPEHCDQQGAVALARRLRDYWFAKGYIVSTRIEPVFAKTSKESESGFTVWCVRSNLAGGLPPKADARAAPVAEAAE